MSQPSTLNAGSLYESYLELGAGEFVVPVGLHATLKGARKWGQRLTQLLGECDRAAAGYYTVLGTDRAKPAKELFEAAAHAARSFAPGASELDDDDLPNIPLVIREWKLTAEGAAKYGDEWPLKRPFIEAAGGHPAEREGAKAKAKDKQAAGGDAQ